MAQYQTLVKRRLDNLSRVLARASVGNFSQKLNIPSEEDEFSELFVGVQLMLDVIEENLSQLHKLTASLALDAEKVKSENRAIVQEKLIDEAILESIGEGMIVADIEGRIAIANAQAKRLLKLSNKDLMGKSFFQTVRVLDLNGQAIPINKRAGYLALQNLIKVEQTDISFQTKRVKQLPVALTASPILLNDAAIGIVLVFRDVSEEREISKAKTEVASFTSHQLRTPLSVINWYTEVLHEEHLGSLNKKQKDYLIVIQDTARQMIELVNTFLSVSRIQLGTMVMKLEQIDLVKVIDDILDELDLQVAQKKLKVTVQHQRQPVVITNDEKMMRVVFHNLIGNAVKYTPEGGSVAIETSSLKEKVNSEDVLVSVIDSGYGIPSKQHSKIFTKLFRAENAQLVDAKGAGLGLYMVKSIVNFAGGEVWFRSRLNKGSSFFVALPKIASPQKVKKA